MKTSSKKGKGRRLQNEVRDLILQYYKQLTQNDVRPAIMGQSGSDIKLSQKGIQQFGFGIQCKNQQKINIWSSLKQCQQNAQKKNLTPLLIFKRNRTKTYAVIQFNRLLQLLNGKA